MSEVHQAAAAAHQGRQQQLLRQKMMEAKERLAALEAAVAAKQQASLTTDNLVKPTLKEPSTVKFVDTPSVREFSAKSAVSDASSTAERDLTELDHSQVAGVEEESDSTQTSSGQVSANAQNEFESSVAGRQDGQRNRLCMDYVTKSWRGFEMPTDERLLPPAPLLAAERVSSDGQSTALLQC